MEKKHTPERLETNSANIGWWIALAEQCADAAGATHGLWADLPSKIKAYRERAEALSGVDDPEAFMDAVGELVMGAEDLHQAKFYSSSTEDARAKRLDADARIRQALSTLKKTQGGE